MIEVKSVVRLISGGPNMTVYHVEKMGDKTYVYCTWYNETTGKYDTDNFHVDILTLIA